MLNRRNKRRLLLFLVFPFLLSVQFITEDIVLRIVGILVTVIYVALLIFLRDSFNNRVEVHEIDLPDSESKSTDDFDTQESFQIVGRKPNLDFITSENINSIRAPRILDKPSDLKERFEEIVNEALPDEVAFNGQFGFVLEKLLQVIKESHHAHTVVYFWYNKKTEKLSIEKFISNSNSLLATNKYNLEDDILSTIVRKSEPELLTDISNTAEADVIRYYDSPQGVKSFVGVPLFYEKNIIGILAMDSKEQDCFGIETIFSLGRFVRLITILISLFEQKFAEYISQKRLTGLLSIIDTKTNIVDEKELVKSIERSVNHFIKWDTFVFVYFDQAKNIFKTQRVINKTTLKYVGENLAVELQGTLVGKSILTGFPVKIDNTSEANHKRFSKNEDISLEGSFLTIPLIYEDQTYGVLCFESLKKNAYSKSDVDFLKSTSGILSYLIYSFSSQNLYRSLISIDIDTKAYNTATFLEKVRVDLARASDLKLLCALALIKIDDFLEQESLFEGNPLPKVLNAIVDVIKIEMNHFTFFGRIEEKVFGVFFVNATSKDVTLWAERTRTKVARQIVKVSSQQTTFTISVGVAAAKEKTDVEDLMRNANLAMQKAIESGGNKVRTIN